MADEAKEVVAKKKIEYPRYVETSKVVAKTATGDDIYERVVVKNKEEEDALSGKVTTKAKTWDK